jgi:hypothetical protein
MDKIVLRSAESAVTEDHYNILARMVAAVSQDHAQMRVMIYEFARITLRKNLYRQYGELGWTGIAERVLALEAAIDRVEADFADNPGFVPAAAEPEPALAPVEEIPELGTSTSTAVALVPEPEREVIVAEYTPPIPPSFLFRPERPTISVINVTDPQRGEKPHAGLWWMAQLVFAAILGVAIYAAIDGRFPLAPFQGTRDAPMNSGAATADQSAAKPVVNRPSGPGFPVPTVYGVYALSNGQLGMLDALPIKVPDARVAISALITTPSHAHLPAGLMQFVVFRRGLVADAPDRVSLRVVAQVTRALTFDTTGKPSIKNVDQSWVVRSKSYQMTVAPVADNPEMIVIRPDPPELVLPAGRYALVLKDGAYDVTLDGPIVDSAHCLERTDALDSPIYTECPDPQSATAK